MLQVTKQKESVGYALGRIYAVCERVEWLVNRSNGKRFWQNWDVASTRPKERFARLIVNFNNNLRLLKTDATREYFKRIINDSLQCIVDFPDVLSLDNQGEFVLGYYHQIAAFKRPPAEFEVNVDEISVDENA